MKCTVGQIAAFLELKFRGNGDRPVAGISEFSASDGDSLVFMDGARGGFPQNFAPACVITTRLLASTLPDSVNVIFSEQPKLDFVKAATI